MIYIGSDHAGFGLKEEIKRYLQDQGLEIEDMGAFSLDPEDDYPDFVIPVAQKVSEDPGKNRGIVLGGTGQGEAIAANRLKGVRAVVYYGGGLEIVELSRKHNNSNILSLGARFLAKEQALEAVSVWLKTEFEGGRHERRIAKIDKA